MQKTTPPVRSVNRVGEGSQFYRLVIVGILFVIAVTGAGCARPSGPRTAAQRDSALRQVAADYARDGDLDAAKRALSRLNLANPVQFIVTLAEQDIHDNSAPDQTRQLALLATALGARSPQLVAYLAPSPTATTPPTLTPTAPPATETSTATAVPPSATPPPPAATATVSPSPTAAQPHVAAGSNVNLRSGPGTAYPVIGQLKAGREANIIGRNASGDWWQLSSDEIGVAGQSWVAGTIVSVLGPIDTVAVAQNIPAPPPTHTPAPVPPTAPPATAAPTQPPKPSVAYVVKSVRLRPIGQDAQHCNSGENSIWAYVQDPAGNRLDGVRVKEIFTGIIHVSGEKGPGAVQWPIYRDGGGQLAVVDDGGNVIGEVSRGMSADWPDFDLMKAAGYCSCKPHPDDASCQADLEHHTYLFAVGHYTFEVVFQRTY